MLLSIIIPIYNVEPYIEKCLKSCIHQKDAPKDSYEIILVNDGTKDNSMDIVRKVLSEYHGAVPVKIINQENAGLSAARNSGMTQAEGEYVWFVDSDDWIDEQSVQRIVSELQKEEIDILQMPYKLIYENNKPEEIEQVKEIKEPIPGPKVMRITRLPNLTQSRIYNRKFLQDNDLKFTPGILHEDAEFKPRAIWKAKKIKTLNAPLYYYLKREKDSITASFTMRNAEGRLYGVKSMYDFSKDLSSKERRLFFPDMNFNMFFVITGLKKLDKKDSERIISSLNECRHIFKEMMWTLSPKKFLVYSLLSLNPSLFLNLYCRKR